MMLKEGLQKAKFDIGVKSFIGMREEQQDSLLVVSDVSNTLVAVCDGMGGLCAGKQASETAIVTLEKLFLGRNCDTTREFLLQVVEAMDESICALKAYDSNTKAGTTVAAAMFADNLMFWLSVGDSRVYIIRDDEAVCVTTDHNYSYLLNKALLKGTISEQEYQQETVRGNALVSFLGMGGVELIDINSSPFVLKPDDTIILASDGLHQHISEKEFVLAIKENQGGQLIADRLIETIQRQNNTNQDNASVIVVRVTEEINQ